MTLAITAAALLGFIDDATKVIFKRSLGLSATAKLIFQFIISTCFILYVINCCGISPVIHFPFLGNLDLGVFTTVLPIGDGIAIP